MPFHGIRAKLGHRKFFFSLFVMAGDEPKSGPSKIDFTSPYYFGSQDNPGNLITPVIFRGDNYEEWSRSVRLSLMARRKFAFLDGTIEKSTDAKKLVDWSCLQTMLVQWILNTINRLVKKTLPYFEEAKPLWDALRHRFNIGNGPRKQQIKAALAECRQPRSMFVADYFGLLQPLWDELATYNPLPACTCNGCTCNLVDKFQAMVDEDWFHDFLYGLNEELYGHVRSSLLAQDPLLTLDRAYQTILQEERNRSYLEPRQKEIMLWLLQ